MLVSSHRALTHIFIHNTHTGPNPLWKGCRCHLDALCRCFVLHSVFGLALLGLVCGFLVFVYVALALLCARLCRCAAWYAACLLLASRLLLLPGVAFTQVYCGRPCCQHAPSSAGKLTCVVALLVQSAFLCATFLFRLLCMPAWTLVFHVRWFGELSSLCASFPLLPAAWLISCCLSGGSRSSFSLCCLDAAARARCWWIHSRSPWCVCSLFAFSLSLVHLSCCRPLPLFTCPLCAA